MHINEKIVIL